MPALDGKTAIVTGASSGIGAATERALVLAGARVAGCALHVNVDELVIKALAQSSGAGVVRGQ